MSHANVVLEYIHPVCVHFVHCMHLTRLKAEPSAACKTMTNPAAEATCMVYHINSV